MEKLKGFIVTITICTLLVGGTVIVREAFHGDNGVNSTIAMQIDPLQDPKPI